MTPQELLSYKEALERLIQVSAPALGRIYKPGFTRHMALAKADEMKMVAAAMHEVGKDYGFEVTYKQGDFEMSNKLAVPPVELGEVSLAERAEQRVTYQEQKRQQNIESVTGTAMLELVADPAIPEEKPNEDWTTRFYNYAQDISNEQMQELWGRLLAGEIRKPGAFSLRTLDLVRNLSTEEAQIFAGVARLAYEIAGVTWVVFRHDEDWLAANRGLRAFSHINLLVELGILDIVNQSQYHLFRGNHDPVIFTCGEHGIVLMRGANSAEITIPIWGFTRVGIDLLQLINKPLDMDYAVSIGRYVVQRGGEAAIAQIVSREITDGGLTAIHYKPIHKVVL